MLSWSAWMRARARFCDLMASLLRHMPMARADLGKLCGGTPPSRLALAHMDQALARVALARAVAAGGEPCPVVIDGMFAGFDRCYADAAVSLLCRARGQVVVFASVLEWARLQRGPLTKRVGRLYRVGTDREDARTA